MIGCVSMQERLVGLDLRRSRLALAACDSSLLKPLLDHAEARTKGQRPQPQDPALCCAVWFTDSDLQFVCTLGQGLHRKPSA